MESVIKMCTFCGEREQKYGGLCSAHAEQKRLGKDLSPVSRRYRGTPAELLRQHSKRSATGCLEWTRARNDNGYGLSSHGLVHRVSYRAFVGEIPDGLFVLHRCDNPPCFEPTHLFLGTQQDNVRDMISKGRQWRNPGYPGEQNPASVLTEEDVLAILADSRSQRAIAADYGVTQAAVSLIKQGKNWPHLHKKASVIVHDRGRKAMGVSHPKAKLTEADVLAIRELLSSDKPPSLVKISRKFGVGTTTVRAIRDRAIWKSL